MDHPFTCLFALCILFGEVSVKVFFFFFFKSSCVLSSVLRVHLFWITVPYQMALLQVFSPKLFQADKSVACLLILLTMFFTEGKL